MVKITNAIKARNVQVYLGKQAMGLCSCASFTKWGSNHQTFTNHHKAGCKVQGKLSSLPYCKWCGSPSIVKCNTFYRCATCGYNPTHPPLPTQQQYKPTKSCKVKWLPGNKHMVQGQPGRVMGSVVLCSMVIGAGGTNMPLGGFSSCMGTVVTLYIGGVFSISAYCVVTVGNRLVYWQGYTRQLPAQQQFVKLCAKAARQQFTN